MRRTLSQSLILIVAGLLGSSGATLRAGTQFYNFDSDPAQSGLTLVGNAQWSATGGNPSGGGYLIITTAANNQRSAILFPDIDAGALVGGFTFDADVRIGNGTSSPADGFSINYVRASDPVLPNLALGNVNGFSDLGNGGDPDLPEEGTQTGISVGFDAWDSGGIVSPPVPPAVGETASSITHDYRGVDIRVDNLLISETQMLTQNGSLTDPTSLQTGPRDGSGSPDILGWAHVHVELKTNGVLNVAYKNTILLTNYQTGFAPSPGRLVFAGRTGGSNQNQDIDNVSLTTVTVPGGDPVVGTVAGNPLGFKVQCFDTAVTVQTNTVTVQLNSTNVTPTLTYANGVTTLVYTGPPLASGSSNTVTVNLTASNGHQVSRTESFMVAPYNLLPATDAVPRSLINTNNSGFLVLPYQTSAGNNNTVAWTEDQLAGYHGANVADLSAATTNASYGSGFYIMPLVNWANAQGNVVDGFQGADSPPGITGANGPGGNGSTANYSEEALAFLEFPAPGIYRMGVNSDDGFKVTEGPNPRDMLAQNLGQFNAGRGSADTEFQFVVPAAGIYPFRLIYEQGGGGANCSWFTRAPNGARVLINDLTNPDAIKAYYSTTRIGPPYLPPYTLGNWRVISPLGFSLTIGDGATPVAPSSVKVQVDGQNVTASTTYANNQTVVSYIANPPFPPNSGHAVSVTFSDSSTPPNTRTYGFYLFVPAYASIPAGFAVSSVDQTKPGFMIEPWQTAATEPNTIIWAEDQIAGLEGTNQANLTGATTGPDGQSYFYWSNPVNFNVNPVSAGGTEQGNFQAPTYPDVQFPGLPGTAGNGTDNSAMEMVTFLQFPAAGLYRMGVNSDDGFQVTSAANPRDRAGIILGNYIGGRGSGDTVFPFYVPQAGIYPFRLVWENGTGGANCEWFIVQPDGSKILINDSSNPNSLKAYAVGPSTGPATAAYVSYVKASTAGIMVSLTDGTTTVTSSSVALALNGAAVTSTVSKTGKVTTLNYTPAAGLAPGFYTLTLTYSDGAAQTRTIAVTATGSGAPLPDAIVASGGYSIGLNFGANENSGGSIAVLAATDVAGVTSVRQANWNNLSGANGGPQANIVADTNGTAATTPVVVQWASPNTWETTGRGEENNSGLTGADHTLMTGYLDSAGNGTTSVNISGLPPELTSRGYDVYIYALGSVTGRGGGYLVLNSDTLQPLTGIVLAQSAANPTTYIQVPDNELPVTSPITAGVYGTGNYILFKGLTAANITVESSTDDPLNNGSALAFGGTPRAPITAVQLVSEYRPLPYIASSSIVQNQVNVPVAAPIQIVVADGSSPVNASTVALSLSNAPVSATVTKTNNLTTIVYTPSPALLPITPYHLALVFSDGTKSYTNVWNFTTSPLGAGTIFVEAEDFNFNHGQWLTNANLGLSGPYNVGAYQGLGNGNKGYFGDGSDYGIDFNTDHASNPSAVYRPTTAIGTEVTGNSPSRGVFSVTNNWDVGWEDTGDWANYTRNFPAGQYLVFASLSSGGSDMHAELDQVTSTANTVNQTLTKLGNFDAFSTHNWQVYTPVPLRDANGNPVQLSLSGTTTLRFTVLPGSMNFDYLAFLPVGGVPPQTNHATLTATSGTAGVSISWSPAGGTLQSSPAIGTGESWTDVGTSNPTVVPTSQLTGEKFYRVKN